MSTPHERLIRTTFSVPFGEVHALVGGAVNARPLLFLHGFPDHPPTAVPFLEHLAQTHRVVAPWLRGYAPSPIIFMELAAQMQPNLVQHSREIHHAVRHFFWAFRISLHRGMNRILRSGPIFGWLRLSSRRRWSAPECVAFWRRNRANETAGFRRAGVHH